MSQKGVSNAERRHADYLRLRGLKTVQAYEGRLLRLRRKEVRRVLSLCSEWHDPDVWPSVIISELSEDYLPKWWEGLYTATGVPIAESTARDLRRAKAADAQGVWLQMLMRYAYNRSGNAIVSVTGTLRDTLLDILADRLAHDLEGGIEKLTREIYASFDGLALWQCRRIAQTEGMIAMADAAHGAVEELEVKVTKTWACSGLANSRESHLAVDGVTVGQDEPFQLKGGLVMYPHDTSLDADAAEIINCACSCIYRPDEGRERRTSTPVQDTPTPPGPAVRTPEEEREERIKQIAAEYSSNIPEEDRKKLAENSLALEKSTGITKGKPMDYAGANEGKENPDYEYGKSHYLNCQTCVPTHEMRRRGFDCTAKDKDAFTATGVNWQKRFLNPDGTTAEYSWSWKYKRDHQFKTMTDKRKYAFVDEATATDGRYEIYVAWKDGKSAHVFCAERSGGKLTYFDPQTNKPAADYLTSAKGNHIGVMRIDNKIINPKIASLFLAKSGK